jgi:hypothetical protein
MVGACWTKARCAYFSWEKLAYVNADACGPSPSLKIRVFLYIKLLHGAWVTDADSFGGG